MVFHHNTSPRSIFLEDDSISLTSKARIHSCLDKGARLWLVARPFICSFRITHLIFTSLLCFHLGLIQPLTSSLLTCECGHGLDIFGTHLARCPFGGQRIATHDAIQNVMYAYVWEGTLYGENSGTPFCQEFHYSQFLHDLRGLGFHCWCGGYWLVTGDDDFKCHYSTGKCNYKTYHHC
jgi:hypothetical protein